MELYFLKCTLDLGTRSIYFTFLSAQLQVAISPTKTTSAGKMAYDFFDLKENF
jgi:hypothetical protein